MQVILEANGLWEMIEPNLTTEVDTKKDKTAIAYIYQSLPEEQLLLISKYKTAKEVWDALKTRHVGVNRVQQAKQKTLKSEFEMLQMEENESIDSFVTRLTGIINKAASVGLAYEDSTLTRCQGKLFRERGRFNKSRGREQDKNNYQSKREERASFEEDTRDKSQVTCYRCHKLGHYAYDCPNKRKNQVREQSNLIEEDLEPTLLMATITEKK
ncbi:zinc finger, CCHC-type containing protein [Tanacetum coccineum]